MITVEGSHQIISSQERLEEVLSKFDGYTNHDFRRKVCELVIGRGGKVLIGPYKLFSMKWDGSLELHFDEPPTAQEATSIVNAAHADDFGMSDNKTLWFWWE